MKSFAVASTICIVFLLAATPASFAGGDFCENPTNCVFQGLRNFALGGAELSLDKNGLLISNIGSTGLDGVQIQNPEDSNMLSSPPTADGQSDNVLDLDSAAPAGQQPNTGHEEWIELGFVAWEAGLDPGDGSFMDFDGTAQISGLGPRTVNLHIEEVGLEAQISTDFSTIGATSLEYRVFNGAAQNGGACLAQPLSSLVTSTVWPVSMAFSEVNWANAVTINLPCGPRVGTRLEIEPIGASNVAKAIRVIALVKTLPAASAPQGGRNLLSADLSSLSITDEAFPGFVFSSIPLVGTVGSILLMTLIAAGGAFVLRRQA